MTNARNEANKLNALSTPVLKINGIGGTFWKRNVKSGSRVGPWLQGEFEILNEAAWKEKAPCLYLVSSSSGTIHYVGISRNRLKDRWRTSPAYDAETMHRLPKDQIFHSQCWKHIQTETKIKPDLKFEIRAIKADAIIKNKELFNTEITALVTAFSSDGESIVAGIERWFCNNSEIDFLNWNVAMTAK